MEVGIGSSAISFVCSERQRSALCTDQQSRNLCDHFWPLTFVIHSSVFDHRQPRPSLVISVPLVHKLVSHRSIRLGTNA